MRRVGGAKKAEVRNIELRPLLKNERIKRATCELLASYLASTI